MKGNVLDAADLCDIIETTEKDLSAENAGKMKTPSKMNDVNMGYGGFDIRDKRKPKMRFCGRCGRIFKTTARSNKPICDKCVMKGYKGGRRIRNL